MRLRIAVILAASLTWVRPLAAFEGKIQYQITDAKGSLHDLSVVVAKGKVRTEMQAKGHAAVSIIDEAAKTVTTLLPDRKAYMVHSFAASAAKAGKPKGALTKTGATATIAGYTADEWTYAGENGAVSLWLAEKLGEGFLRPSASAGSVEIPAELKGKGLALRIQKADGFKMEALKVEPGSPDAGLFVVPDGYSDMGAAVDAAGGNAAAGGAGPSAGTAPAMPADAQERMNQAMQNMTPEQRAMMQKMMQNQGAAPPQ